MRRALSRAEIVIGLVVLLLAAWPVGVSAQPDNPYADTRIVAYSSATNADVNGWNCEIPVDRVTRISVGQGDMVMLCVTLVNFSDEMMSYGILRDGPDAIWDYSHVPLLPNRAATFEFSYRADEAQTFSYFWHPIDASGDMLATWTQIEVEVGPERDPDPPDDPTGPALPGLPLSAVVVEPGIELEVTVGPDEGEGVCGTEDELVVESGTPVRYCYAMTNVGDETVDVHSLFDDQLGWLFEDEIVIVEPGDSAVRSAVAVADESALSVATWTAERQDSGAPTAAADSAAVIVADPCPTVEPTDEAPPPVPPAPPLVAPDPTTTGSPTPPTASPTTPTTATTSTVPPYVDTTTTVQPPPSTTDPTFVVRTTTTFPVFVIVTTTTDPDVPVGFGGGHRGAGDFAPNPCPSSEPPDESDPPDETDPPDGSDPPDETDPPDGNDPPDETDPPDGNDPPGGSDPSDGGDPPGGLPAGDGPSGGAAAAEGGPFSGTLPATR